MELTGIILVVVFFALLLLNVPISISIGVATLLAMLMNMDVTPATITIAQRMVGGLNSFALLAIPFFVLSGLIMGRGGIAKRLIECAMALIGALPGGLALVNVVSCMMFGAISGSAVAATSAIGSFMLPEMKKAGYEPNFSAAVTAAAATTGMLQAIDCCNELLAFNSFFDHLFHSFFSIIPLELLLDWTGHLF